jgi:hypothetical protein
LGIDHVTVGDDDDGGEQLLILGVLQVGEEMSGPRNGVGLARACRMLDEELATRALLQNLGLQFSGGIELVIAGEDGVGDLLLIVAPGDRIATDDFEPAIPLPNLFPKVAGAVTRWIERVTAVQMRSPNGGE